MNQSDTPRTHAEAVFIWPTIDGIKEENHPCGDYVPARLAFELERENAKLREALKRRHAEQSYPMPDYVKLSLANRAK